MIKTLESKLIARYFTGNCSNEELEKIRQWLEKEQGNRELMEEYKHIWEASEDRQEALSSMFDAEQDWKDLQERITSDQAKAQKIFSGKNGMPVHLHSGIGHMLRIAAVIIIASLSGVIAYQNLYSPPVIETVEPALREIVTNRGQRANLALSDGTKVQLNADSKITLPNVFQANKREVFLEGEAFFDVAKNPDKPFLIHTKAALVEVLGTSLGVRSYPEDKTVRVVVKEGRVSLSYGNLKHSEEAILVPGELGHLNLVNDDITTKKVEDLEVLLSWTKGYLKFKDTPMSEVAFQLERKYDIDVDLSTARIKEMRLTAVFKSRSIRNVLDVISTSLGIKYEMNQQNVIFEETNKDQG